MNALREMFKKADCDWAAKKKKDAESSRELCKSTDSTIISVEQMRKLNEAAAGPKAK